jgi:hypothetical protein
MLGDMWGTASCSNQEQQNKRCASSEGQHKAGLSTTADPLADKDLGSCSALLLCYTILAQAWH